MNQPGSHESFDEYRRMLFGIAYRMLGSVSDAEDVMQDAWLRWDTVDSASVENPRAYLTQMVTRLCIDALRRLGAERAVYSGPWLPEPILNNNIDGATPEDKTELAQTLSIGLLMLLEQIPANERATFVLREAFDYSYEEIAGCLNAAPATCRQWARRARQRLTSSGWEERRGVAPELLEQFVAAIDSQNIENLLEVLDQDAILISDGGGKVAAATRPLHGARAVSRFLLGITSRVHDHSDARFVGINGHLGGVVWIDHNLDSVFALERRGNRISHIYIVRNPDKLAKLKQSIQNRE